MKTFDEILLDEATKKTPYSVSVLWGEITRMGFKKSGRVYTVQKDKMSLSKTYVEDIISGINTLGGFNYQVKDHDKFIDIV